MGNGAVLRRIPRDLTKCTDVQLQYLINSMIINNPWSDNDAGPLTSLRNSIKEMKQRGFRPITPQEYRQALVDSGTSCTGTGGKSVATTRIKVWVSCEEHCKRPRYEVSTTPNMEFENDVNTGTSAGSQSESDTVSMRVLLPISREGVAEELTELFSAVLSEEDLPALLLDRYGDEGEDGDARVDTQLDTQEWPTHDQTIQQQLEQMESY